MFKILIFLGLIAFSPLRAYDTYEDFKQVQQEARGQVVHFNAWGGSQTYNNYIKWAIDEFQKTQATQVIHVKLNDTGDAVQKVILDKQNKTQSGVVDIIWVNGDNFRKLKEKSLLFGPITKYLPNYQFVREASNPSIAFDFGTPTDGYSAPWGKAQFVFVHNPKKTPFPPKNAQELLNTIKKNPYKFAYPKPTDFTGMSFLKQILLDTSPNPDIFKNPVDKIPNIERETQGLWQYLDQIHPFLWQQGKVYPQNESALLKLFADGEIDFSFSFNVSVAANAIEQKIIPPNSQAYVFKKGTIGNYHFLVIPANAKSKEGALAFINFLLSPQAQARKLNPEFWGEPTILDMKALSPQDAQLFRAIPVKQGQVSDEDLKRVIGEPHPSLVPYLEQQWLLRYGKS